MMGNHLRLKQGFSWPNNDENNEAPPVNIELPLIGEHDELNELWEEGLNPNLSQIAEPLLNRAIRRLEDRYITLSVWQKQIGTGIPIAIAVQPSNLTSKIDIFLACLMC